MRLRLLSLAALFSALFMVPTPAGSSEAAGQRVPGKRLGLKPDPAGTPKLKIHWRGGTPPASPPACDHHAGWRMNLGGNDRYGDCGPASAANHLQMTRRYLLGRDSFVELPQILDLYRRSTSPPFDPATGANDEGVVMSDLLAAMSAGGIDGDKVIAFAAFHDRSDASLQAAINEFGGVLLAVNLQQSQQGQTDRGVWDYQRSGAWGGHAILSGKYDRAKGSVSVVTWGKEVATTPAFRRYQLAEVWLPVWESAVRSGRFFAQVDEAQFRADYLALTGSPFPDVFPPPAPPTPPGPPAPPAPGAGFTGTVTYTYANGQLVGAPAVNAPPQLDKAAVDAAVREAFAGQGVALSPLWEPVIRAIVDALFKRLFGGVAAESPAAAPPAAPTPTVVTYTYGQTAPVPIPRASAPGWVCVDGVCRPAAQPSSWQTHQSATTTVTTQTQSSEGPRPGPIRRLFGAR